MIFLQIFMNSNSPLGPCFETHFIFARQKYYVTGPLGDQCLGDTCMCQECKQRDCSQYQSFYLFNLYLQIIIIQFNQQKLMMIEFPDEDNSRVFFSEKE